MEKLFSCSPPLMSCSCSTSAHCDLWSFLKATCNCASWSYELALLADATLLGAPAAGRAITAALGRRNTEEEPELAERAVKPAVRPKRMLTDEAEKSSEKKETEKEANDSETERSCQPASFHVSHIRQVSPFGQRFSWYHVEPDVIVSEHVSSVWHYCSDTCANLDCK